MRGFLLFALFVTGTALAQAPSAAGLPFSPTMPYSVNDVPNREVAPANGGFSSGYYYGYGQYGYGYPGYGNGYGYGYGPNSYYNRGPSYNGNNYSQTYQGYNGTVGARRPGYTYQGGNTYQGYNSNVGARYPVNGQQTGNPTPRSFPSASQESSLHRGW